MDGTLQSILRLYSSGLLNINGLLQYALGENFPRPHCFGKKLKNIGIGVKSRNAETLKSEFVFLGIWSQQRETLKIDFRYVITGQTVRGKGGSLSSSVTDKDLLAVNYQI